MRNECLERVPGGQYDPIETAVNKQQGPVDFAHEKRIRVWGNQRIGEGRNSRFPEVKGRKATLPASGTLKAP